MSDAIVHGLSSESNISDHYTSLDETLGAPMSIEDLFKEFCWDEELDDLNLNTGAEGSVFLPTSYMDGSLGSTVEPSKTIATKPSEILTTDPSKTIITEPWETINEPSNTTREASETPSFPSPPTPDCYVPMPLPIPMPMSAFLKTPQEPVLPQSTRDLEEASIRVQMSILQERLTGIQQQKLQPQQDFQKQEWPEKQSWLQQPQELQQPRRFQQPRGFWQRQGLRQPEGLQQQPCPYAPQEIPSSPQLNSWVHPPTNGHFDVPQTPQDPNWAQKQAPAEPRPQPRSNPQPPAQGTYEFDNTFAKNFFANPENHGRWVYMPDGSRIYLNAPKEQKRKTTRRVEDGRVRRV